MNGVAVGIAFQWQNIIPFGILSAGDFLLGPPPALTSNEYAKAYNEVMTVGSSNSTERPQDRARRHLLCRFLANPGLQSGSAASGAGTGTFLNRKRSRSGSDQHRDQRQPRSIIPQQISLQFWRPETAIHAGETDGNPKTEPDPSYVPFIVTPCFPSYPSNHGSAANAAAAVLRRLYGEAGHSITLSNPAVATIVLQYRSFKQITDDISDARVYGGIHFRTDQEAGADLGRAVGKAVYKNNLCPVHDDN